MRILGIDPGFGRMGFAVLEKNKDNADILFSECIETEKDIPFEERLHIVIEKLKEHIHTYTPEHIVLEKLFFAKNKKTALQIAEVRGACTYIAQEKNIPYFEYTPKEIKQAITGNGNADKKDMMRMIPLLITIKKEKKMLDDEYDAIAIGITHLESIRYSNT